MSDFHIFIYDFHIFIFILWGYIYIFNNINSFCTKFHLFTQLLNKKVHINATIKVACLYILYFAGRQQVRNRKATEILST